MSGMEDVETSIGEDDGLVGLLTAPIDFGDDLLDGPDLPFDALVGFEQVGENFFTTDRH